MDNQTLAASKPTPVLSPSQLPDRLDSVGALEDLLVCPTQALIDDLAQVWPAWPRTPRRTNG